MAPAVSMHGGVTIKKSLFSTKVVYAPTQSPIKSFVLEYSLSEGERIGRLFDMSLDKMSADIEKNGKPVAGANGHYRLEICLSDDCRFCAAQLFRFTDFTYNAVFPVRFYEGMGVETITLLL